MKYRNLDYAVRERVPGRWHWHILPEEEPCPVLTSDKQYRSREAGVEACINEIDNRLARTSSLRAKATRGARCK